MLKKIFIIIFVFTTFYFGADCLAQDPLQNIAENSGYSTNVDEYSLSQTVGGYIKVILGVLGVIFFVLTFYAGFLWLTAGGDEGKITKAKDIILAATIGLAIVVLSYGITVFIVGATIKASKPQGLVGS